MFCCDSAKEWGSMQRTLHFLRLRPAIRTSLIVAIAVLAGSALHAQTVVAATGGAAPAAQAETLAYDVAAIRPNKSGDNGSDIDFDDYGNFSAKNSTIKILIQAAYGMRRDLVLDVPRWAQEERFDIEAKIVEKPTTKLTSLQNRALLRALLASRFQLKAHMETRTLPLYELIVGKNGIKMTAVDRPKDGPTGFHGGNGSLRVVAGPMDMFANVLSNAISSVVINKTGLTGRYDFTLKWSPDETKPIDDAPSIFTAVQEQLGLKLQPARGPVEVLVVDSVEHPSAN